MIKICKIDMVGNGLLVSLPPNDDGFVSEQAYTMSNKNYAIDFLWDIAELCDIQDEVRITKARKRKG